VSSRASRLAFRGGAALVYAFLYLPLFIIVLYAFNKTNINSWPFPGFSTRWFEKLADDQAPKEAAVLSLRIALFSTAFALLLGTGMAFAFARFRFFGREALNFVVTLPIILPGAITGVALASFFLFAKVDLSTRTVIVGHTTFCIVVVFNNVLARLRRVARSMEEASQDLGASGLQTFRYVTFPTIRTAVVAGALLAFALSFDEIAVTFFLAGADTRTLPLWVLGSLRETQQVPEVNAVAAAILVISIPLIALSAYLMRDEGAAGRVVQGE
jgi:putative spermidine/putrescine transport system permease protein